jgi:hypothetical protein
MSLNGPQDNGQHPDADLINTRARQLLDELSRLLAEKDAQCAALQAQLAAQTEEMRQLRTERNDYLRTIFSLLPPGPEVTFTAEEIEDLQRNGLSLSETIESLGLEEND